MQVDLTDQVALVTGSAKRVGRAIALELAKKGVHIMVHYRSSEDDQVRNTIHEIKSFGVDAFAVQADVSTAEGVDITFQEIKKQFGNLHILVNSASLFHKNTLMETTLEHWQQSLNVNLTGAFLCTQSAVHMMRQNTPRGGAIINILDYGAVQPWAERADHSVSKAGLLMLTKISAVSLGKENIRVNGVLPGPVMRDAGNSEELWQKIGQSLPIGHTGDPSDVGRAVVFLAQEDFITGTILNVNGGEDL